MGKKGKKKPRSGQKDKRVPSTSLKTVIEQGTSISQTPGNEVTVVLDRGICPHIDKGLSTDKIAAKLEDSASLRCEDCRGHIVESRANKGKGKPGKKGGTVSKSDSKAIWVCLECGHFACGGLGLPTTPQSHAVRHAKQNHHPLVVNYKNHQLLWCFSCNKIVPEDIKYKEALKEVSRMLKRKPGEGSNVDVEDVWFGSGSVTSAIRSGDYEMSVPGVKAVYSIRGLTNLGNTCFFNSIMQNLLAIDSLREYLFKLDESVGPLIASLRKFFLEISSEGGSKGTINPRSLFGILCTKAPQFRGYQQHDSHELLRCLLDGLSTEELSSRILNESSQTLTADPTFVDSIFGGQLSSTVSCLECGHSSTIYESFLDLSLPVPMKRPPGRKVQHVARGKKPKLPPRRSGRNYSKMSRELNNIAHSTADKSLGGLHTTPQPAEQMELSSDPIDPNATALDMGFTVENLSPVQKLGNKQADENVVEQSASFDNFDWLDYLDPTSISGATDPNATALDMGFTVENLLPVQKLGNKQAVENVGEQSASFDNFDWLDYLDPTSISGANDVVIETEEISTIPGSANEKAPQNDISLSVTMDSKDESNLITAFSATSLDSVEHYNPSGAGSSASFDDKQNERLQSSVCLFTQEVTHNDADVGHNPESCSQDVFTKDSNTSERDDENPSQIQDSVVILLPSMEVTPSVPGCELESVDFVGLGDLFNEPEVPSDQPPSEANAKNVIIGNISESDPDEVDDGDAPVSVESCLALFTKPELLFKDEHAWQCDNCSKVLREQKIRSRSKLQLPESEAVQNGCQDKNPSVDKDLDVFDPSVEIYENGKCMRLNSETEASAGLNLNNQDVNPCHEESESGEKGLAEMDAQSAESEMDLTEQEEANLEKLKVKRDAMDLTEQEDATLEKLKVKRDATKTILIRKVPSVLTIQLKRFSQDARGRLSKLNGHVNFRETIDLKPYMDPRCIDKETFRYRLVGLVEHLGSMRGGHYVAYVRGVAGKEFGDSVWYHASDAYVRQSSLEEVMRSQAYILFYEKI